MQQMFINNKAPFYRLARIIRLDYIEQQPLINSLNRRFAQVELNLPEKYSETIVKLTKGHPYYTQLAFQQVLLINILERLVP